MQDRSENIKKLGYNSHSIPNLSQRQYYRNSVIKDRSTLYEKRMKYKSFVYEEDYSEQAQEQLEELIEKLVEELEHEKNLKKKILLKTSSKNLMATAII